MHQQASGAVDTDGQDSCSPLPADARLGAVPGTQRRPSRVAVSEAHLTDMFPEFPALFLVCSHSLRIDSSCSGCPRFSQLIYLHLVRLLGPYFHQSRTLGTQRTGKKGHELHFVAPGNIHGTARNEPCLSKANL